ncbi:hypothetical protein DFH11DRAFT_257702 [Phellopilus nigrolimitatus]|nr:hypothetical protein DFH11DRAFT_257702 [Phellopilus nigrolimitatus]
MRVVALFSRNKKLAIVLKFILIVEATFMLGNLIYSGIYEKIALGSLAKGSTICGAERFTPIVWAALYWTVPLLFEFILLALVLYKAILFWRTSGSLQDHFGLLKLLVRDQVFYFVMVMLCSIASIANSWTSASASSSTFLLNLFAVFGNAPLLCIIGSRLLIGLKEAGDIPGSDYSTSQ